MPIINLDLNWNKKYTRNEFILQYDESIKRKNRMNGKQCKLVFSSSPELLNEWPSYTGLDGWEISVLKNKTKQNRKHCSIQ